MQMQIIQTDTSLTISQSTEAIHLDLQYCFYILANTLANRNRQLRYLTESQHTTNPNHRILLNTCCRGF